MQTFRQRITPELLKQHIHAAAKNFKSASHRSDYDDFRENIDANCADLFEELASGTYNPKATPIFRRLKADGTTRQIARLCVRDMVVQCAVLGHLQNVLGQHAFDWSCCRKGFGAPYAKALIYTKLVNLRPTWILKTDIANCYGSIRHDDIMAVLHKYTGDAPLVELIGSMLRAATVDEAGNETPTRLGITTGYPVGLMLVNLLLHHHVDVEIKRQVLDITQSAFAVRYVDDIVIGGGADFDPKAARGVLQNALRSINMKLKKEKTTIVRGVGRKQDVAFEMLGGRYESHQLPSGLFTVRHSTPQKSEPVVASSAL